MCACTPEIRTPFCKRPGCGPAIIVSAKHRDKPDGHRAADWKCVCGCWAAGEKCSCCGQSLRAEGM